MQALRIGCKCDRISARQPRAGEKRGQAQCIGLSSEALDKIRRYRRDTEASPAERSFQHARFAYADHRNIANLPQPFEPRIAEGADDQSIRRA
ncbi:hypothetical protein D3C80_1692710 [compost metagenome]